MGIKLQLQLLPITSQSTKTHIKITAVTFRIWPADFIAKYCKCILHGALSAHHNGTHVIKTSQLTVKTACYVRTWWVGSIAKAWVSETACDVGESQNFEIALVTEFRGYNIFLNLSCSDCFWKHWSNWRIHISVIARDWQWKFKILFQKGCCHSLNSYITDLHYPILTLGFNQWFSTWSRLDNGGPPGISSASQKV